MAIYMLMVDNQHNNALIKLELEEIERRLVKYPKDKVPFFKFIKTVPFGRTNGHILFGRDIVTGALAYHICIRRTDEVCLDTSCNWLLSMKVGTLARLEKFAKDHTNMFPNDGYEDRRLKQIQNGVIHFKQSPALLRTYFVHKDTGQRIQYTTMREVASTIKCSTNSLIDAVKSGAAEIKGFIIHRPEA